MLEVEVDIHLFFFRIARVVLGDFLQVLFGVFVEQGLLVAPEADDLVKQPILCRPGLPPVLYNPLDNFLLDGMGVHQQFYHVEQSFPFLQVDFHLRLLLLEEESIISRGFKWNLRISWTRLCMRV